jgi:hypothetical protein
VIDRINLTNHTTGATLVNTLDIGLLSGSAGFTKKGEPCITYPGSQCPIRLVTTWQLVDMGGDTYPVGYYFSYGYALSYYFPTSSPPAQPTDYGFQGNAPATVLVSGYFFYNDDDNPATNITLAAHIRQIPYDFTIMKEVP